MSTETSPLTLAETTATALIARIEAGETVTVASMIAARGAIWAANDAAGGPTAHPIADRLSAELERVYAANAAPVAVAAPTEKEVATAILGRYVASIHESRQIVARAQEVAAKPIFRGQAAEVRRLQYVANCTLSMGGIYAAVQAARPDLDVCRGRAFFDEVDRLIALV